MKKFSFDLKNTNDLAIIISAIILVFTGAFLRFFKYLLAPATLEKLTLVLILGNKNLEELMATITHARESVIQTLYALEAGNDDAVKQFEELLKDRKIKGQKAEFAKKLLSGVLEHKDEIDKIIKDHLIDWSFERLDKIDKQILRMGIYELKYTDTPYQIIIDEAVKIAKNFSEDKSKSFINGILDKVAKEIRA